MRATLTALLPILVLTTCSPGPEDKAGTSAPVMPSTTLICGQTWSTRNLDVATYRNGDPIPQVTDPTAWTELTTGAWCWYNNDSVTYHAYGRLYNWYAVNDPWPRAGRLACTHRRGVGSDGNVPW
ncbi:MAG: fibrobacter succinogenes major paralogous domain-containing protein [Flavobacteriales bacterium]|nr:fibrobacter succinogenes major paralogous domain-containing protein [Flavobacteriales bacterium]